MFIDGELFQENTITRTYAGGKECDENFVGRESRGEDSSTFRGEMGTLHFFELPTRASLVSTHNTLKKVFRILPMSELFPLLAYGKDWYDNWPELQECVYFKELTDLGMPERVFLVANPKFAGKLTPGGEKVYSFAKKTGKHAGVMVDICGQIEKVYPQTRVYHNSPAKDTFLAIRGLLCFFPLVQKFADSFDFSTDYV